MPVKLVMFAEYGRDVVAPGILTPDGVVTLHDLLAPGPPNARMIGLMDDFGLLRPRLDDLVASAEPIPLNAASPTTGSTPSVIRARSTCS